MRILRQCRRFADNLDYLLELTKHQPVEWFDYVDVVTDRDDESIIDWRSVVENIKRDGYATNEHGLLVNMQDHGIKASNCIEAVTTYVDYADGSHMSSYMLRKTVFSPFPCDKWGRLPLTLHQWSEIALPIINTRALWQWQHAVNYYAARNNIQLWDGFQYEQAVGWNLVLAKRIDQAANDKAHKWTGPIIYFLSATTSLQPQAKIGSPE